MRPWALAVGAVMTVAGLGSTMTGNPATAATAHKAFTCPVTGEKIASAKAAAGHSVYKGKTYYFCCAMCKPKFDKAPAKYSKNAARGKYEKM